MKRYYVTDEQLTAIADAIREGKGLNMYDPSTGKVYIQPNTEYTFSKDVTFDGNTSIVELYKQILDGRQSAPASKIYTDPPAAGTTKRITHTFTSQSDVLYVENVDSGLPEENIQLEKGGTAREYNAFQKLEFPDEFVSTLKA